MLVGEDVVVAQLTAQNMHIEGMAPNQRVGDGGVAEVGAGLGRPHAAGVHELAPELSPLPPAGVGGVGAKRREDAKGGAGDGGGGRRQSHVLPHHHVVTEPGGQAPSDEDQGVLPLPKEHADERPAIRDHHGDTRCGRRERHRGEATARPSQLCRAFEVTAAPEHARRRNTQDGGIRRRPHWISARHPAQSLHGPAVGDSSS